MGKELDHLEQWELKDLVVDLRAQIESMVCVPDMDEKLFNLVRRAYGA